MKNGFYIDNTPLPLIKNKAFGFKHGFSTREGGVSVGGGRDSLDLGAGEGEDVSENRKRFARALGTSDEKLVFAKQIHSNKVVTVTAENYTDKFECDGFVTAEKGILLAVKTADCVPILLCDKENGVIGALHAGWRGTVSGIALKGVEKMKELGSDEKNVAVLIGPCIHSCCYEVDIPFVDAVKSSEYGASLVSFIKEARKPEKFYASLTDMNKHLLKLSGIREENIYVSELCTCCNRSMLFSHRASQGKRGLMMAAAVM